MMKTFFLLITFSVSVTGFSQTFLGKNKTEIKEMIEKNYDEVKVVSESTTSIKLKCDAEVNEFFLSDGICVRFTSLKSYKCNCLAGDIKAYNENLKSVGNMKWINEDESKLYEIILNNKDYIVSISNNTSDMALLDSK